MGHEFYSQPSNSLPARSDQLDGKALSFDPPQHGDDENVGFLMTENHFGPLKGRFFSLANHPKSNMQLLCVQSDKFYTNAVCGIAMHW